MTPETDQPQAAAPSQQQGQAPQGQPQGHRRRRRRRKSQAGSNAAKNQSPTQASGQPGFQANVPSGAPSNGPGNGQPTPQKQKSSNRGRFAKNNSNSNGGSNGNGQGQGQGNARRKSKPRRQQVFVGPMDHSYRVANGNMADGPPSTIEFRNVNGNGNGNGYHYEHEAMPAVAPIREDAPTRIFFFIEDLFFLAKIQETSRKLGVKVGFLKADKDVVARLSSMPDEEKPSLIVFDLNNVGAKPLTLIPKIKAKLKRGTSVIGFLSHLQGDLKVKATEAGCDMVMPRSAFSQNLPNLLRRHGLEEELEPLEA
jgi:hypothetical protein